MLQRADLWSLEQYSEARSGFREEVLAHKQNRRVRIGDHILLIFEDQLTIKYQIQEMLRIERIFEASAIDEELDAYNPLIPDGANLKATFMLEYGDVAERKEALIRLLGVEDKIWIRVGDHDLVRPIADEDLDRSRDEKTSAVHFVRFEFTDAMVADAKRGAPVSIGIDHAEYTHSVDPLPAPVRDCLVGDFA